MSDRWTRLAALALAGACLTASACDSGDVDTQTIAPEDTVADIDTSAASDATSDAPVGDGPPYLGDLAFDWPRDCTVDVRETVVKGDTSARLSYSLDLTAGSSDLDHIIVSFVDLTVDTIDGEVVPPAANAQLRRSFLLPDFVIDRDGYVVELRGLGQLIDDLNAANPAGPPLELSPDVEATFAQAVSEKYWGTWAGTWADVGSITDTTQQRENELTVGGEDIVIPVTIESLPADDGRASLTLEARQSGDSFLRALGFTADDIAGTSGALDEITDASRTSLVTAELDPTDLMPSRASIETTIELTSGARTESQFESRAFEFDWANSDCG